jgi:O-antigen/teichoic acid export membrane protein
VEERVASLTKRTIILIICRTLNFGVQLLSPIFLTRILGDAFAYGQYREFVLYATMSAVIIDFSIQSNLLYFIPKRPEKERESVTNSALFLLVTSVIGILAIFLGRNLIRAHTSYDFIAPLMVYVFFFVNLDFFETYSLGRRRTLAVLYYSTARIVVRIVSVIVAAYISHDIMFILKVMIVVEVVKFAFLAFFFRRHFTRHIDRELIREQMRFIVPLGSTGVIGSLNTQLAQFVISVTMGAERLAFYTIGSYQVPFLNIIRSSVIDTLFPEMTIASERDRLKLWQRANVVFCFMIFPVFAVFMYHARTFIETLFTAQYAAAVPLFRIYLFMMLLQCFEMGTPLRTANQNRWFVFGGILSLTVDIGFILAFFKILGFIAPALAIVLGEISIALFLGWKVMRLYSVDIGGLFMWKKILSVVTACIASLPVLFAGELFALNAVVRAVVFSSLYLAAYLLVVGRFRVEEIEFIRGKAIGVLRRTVLRGGRP